VFDNLISSLYFFALLAFVHGLSRKELPARLWMSRPAGAHAVAIAAPVVLIIIAVGGWALNAPGLARARTLVQAISSTSDPAATLDNFKKALGPGAWPGGPMGYQEVVEQLANFAGNSIAASQAANDIKQGYYETSLSAMSTIMKQRKGDARLELFASGLYGQFGQIPDAIAHAKAALALSPNKQQILFQLGLSYLNGGDSAEALAAFKQAYDEAPENDQALIYYAMGLYYGKDTAAADKLIVDRFGSTIVDNDQILQVYGNLKLYDRVIAIWKMRVDKNPKDFNTNLSLASAYYAAGDKASTIKQLKGMETLNPAAAGQLEQLIAQIEHDQITITPKK
jgi:tetratricopeptide (TPR) repeat protein